MNNVERALDFLVQRIYKACVVTQREIVRGRFGQGTLRLRDQFMHLHISTVADFNAAMPAAFDVDMQIKTCRKRLQGASALPPYHHADSADQMPQCDSDSSVGGSAASSTPSSPTPQRHGIHVLDTNSRLDLSDAGRSESPPLSSAAPADVDDEAVTLPIYYSPEARMLLTGDGV